MKTYLQTDFDEDSDHLVEVSDELNIWAAPFGLKLLENIKYLKNITALDIGFGTGFPLTEIAMRLGNSCKVYGIDPWEAAIRRTRKKVEIYGITNLQIIQGMAESIPLEDDSVNLITSNNGLNNVADLDKVLGECSRVMRKDGQFIQTINLNDSMKEFYDLLYKVLLSQGMEAYIEKMNQQIYSKRKPLQEVTDLIQSHDFVIEKVINDRFEYIFADGSSMLNHFFIRLAFMDGWKSIVPQSKQEEIFSQLEILMNQQARERGRFVLSIPFVVIDCAKR